MRHTTSWSAGSAQAPKSHRQRNIILVAILVAAVVIAAVVTAVLLSQKHHVTPVIVQSLSPTWAPGSTWAPTLAPSMTPTFAPTLTPTMTPTSAPCAKIPTSPPPNAFYQVSSNVVTKTRNTMFVYLRVGSALPPAVQIGSYAILQFYCSTYPYITNFPAANVPLPIIDIFPAVAGGQPAFLVDTGTVTPLNASGGTAYTPLGTYYISTLSPPISSLIDFPVTQFSLPPQPCSTNAVVASYCQNFQGSDILVLVHLPLTVPVEAVPVQVGDTIRIRLATPLQLSTFTDFPYCVWHKDQSQNALLVSTCCGLAAHQLTSATSSGMTNIATFTINPHGTTPSCLTFAGPNATTDLGAASLS